MGSKITIAVRGGREYSNRVARDIRECRGMDKYNIITYDDENRFFNKPYQYDAVFLDACIEEAYRTAERLGKLNVPVIFMTPYDDALIKAARLMPFRIMPMEYNMEQLEEVILSIERRFDDRLCGHIMVLYCKNMKISVFVENILYIRRDGHLSYFYMADKRVYAAYEERLDYGYINKNKFFVRINIDCVINCYYAIRLNGYDIVIGDGEKLAVSRKRIGTVRRVFSEAEKYRRHGLV